MSIVLRPLQCKIHNNKLLLIEKMALYFYWINAISIVATHNFPNEFQGGLSCCCHLKPHLFCVRDRSCENTRLDPVKRLNECALLLHTHSVGCIFQWGARCLERSTAQLSATRSSVHWSMAWARRPDVKARTLSPRKGQCFLTNVRSIASSNDHSLHRTAWGQPASWPRLPCYDSTEIKRQE